MYLLENKSTLFMYVSFGIDQYCWSCAPLAHTNMSELQYVLRLCWEDRGWGWWI